ncbi:four-carbon acid sugar kinase family protein [Alicyclobacillus vulcanalis]|uniref:Uncharacterized conserved protein YgbK, DUF1537 family n=2 Tax=Alicyclobacillus TaxID=29330 RepID=A0A1N7LLH8_9BACL|nr:four-carbon acid sugar kinase family protein [Alicyclobacillus vulcanalis]SIS74695.1 Uncharacterized conserved protein YgbK, DUF1537 family [Alicyclobacillus vulcanalis]
MKVLVFADDLTGGSGTAALLKEIGFETLIHLATVPKDPFLESLVTHRMSADSHLDLDEAHVLDLGTRNDTGVHAAAVLQAWLDATDVSRIDLVGLRIDSTLRGPIAPSLDVLLQQDERRIAIVVAAHPRSGRTTLHGVHLVNGVPVHLSSVGNDPFSPVLESNLASWIGGRSRFTNRSVDINIVRRGSRVISKIIEDSYTNGVKVLFCDAETESDINTIARAAVDVRGNVPCIHPIPVDPGPLTAAMVREQRGRQYARKLGASVLDSSVHRSTVAGNGEKRRVYFSESSEHYVTYYGDRVYVTDLGPTVFGISASLMKEAREQIDRLENNDGVVVIRYAGESVEEIVRQMRDAVNRRNVIANSGRNGGCCPVRVLFLRTDTWEAPIRCTNRVTAFLPTILRAVLEEFPSLQGLYLSGGDAARVTLSRVGVTRLMLLDEIAPITVLSKPIDGLLAGKWVIMKGGAMGDHMAVVDAIERLYHEVHKANLGARTTQ